LLNQKKIAVNLVLSWRLSFFDKVILPDQKPTTPMGNSLRQVGKLAKSLGTDALAATQQAVNNTDVQPAGKVHSVDSVNFSAQCFVGEMVKAPSSARFPFFPGAIERSIVVVRAFHVIPILFC
jgi:hypothetical protein